MRIASLGVGVENPVTMIIFDVLLRLLLFLGAWTDNETEKTFKYTTERLQPMPTDLTTSLLRSSSFHFLASPDLLQDQMQQLLDLRKESNTNSADLFVWEPLPGLCKPEMRAAHLAAARLVHVFSPNHLECLALFGHSEALDKDMLLDRQQVEGCAHALLDSGIGPEGTGVVIIRAGEDGCLVSSKSIPGRHKWLPPFYNDESYIVDATGAGNTFLGALTFAMSSLTGGDVVEAAVLASVATSFSLEQIGLPKLSIGGKEDLWNGESFIKRCAEYRQKLNAV